VCIARQTLRILSLLLATHRANARDALLTCIGFVIAAATLTILLAIPAGIDRISGATGQREIAMVLSGNMLDEAHSTLSPEQVAILSHLPQVARNQNGRPLAAPQFIANTRLIRPDGQPATVMVRGVTADIWELLDSVQVHTRTDVNLREGSRQILASNLLAQQFEVLRQPDFRLQGREWQLAGSLDAGGNLWESELWTDFSALQAAYNRPGVISSLWLKLAAADAINDLKENIRSDRRLDGISVQDQVSYYQHRVDNIAQFTRAMAAGISILLGLGACLVISGMLGIVLHNRRKQLTTLRSLGFDQWAIILANILDVLVIGTISALIMAGLAWRLLDGVSFGAANYQQAVYAYFVVDFKVVATVVIHALILGVVSSIIPLCNIMRDRLVTALQE